MDDLLELSRARVKQNYGRSAEHLLKAEEWLRRIDPNASHRKIHTTACSQRRTSPVCRLNIPGRAGNFLPCPFHGLSLLCSPLIVCKNLNCTPSQEKSIDMSMHVNYTLL